jgi:hypothetical protein
MVLSYKTPNWPTLFHAQVNVKGALCVFIVPVIWLIIPWVSIPLSDASYFLHQMCAPWLGFGQLMLEFLLCLVALCGTFPRGKN